MASNLQSFFKCDIFNGKKLSERNFETNQRELFLKEILEDGKHKYDVLDVVYSCEWTEGSLWKSGSKEGVCIVIPIRDDHELLKYTLNNLQENKILDNFSVVVVDDRSSNDGVKTTTMESGCSYLRVDNDKGFNFSMLCNLGAFAAYSYGDFEDVLMWNSDMWAKNPTDLQTVVKKHRDESAKITGSKLVYPPFSWNDSSEQTNNMKISFKGLGFDPANTVQFGGGTILSGPNGMMMPEHFGRFQSPDSNTVNRDSHVSWVTGAFHIINLEWFLGERGYNPSLAKAYQDVDLCLRAVLQDNIVLYAGKNVEFYHDESLQHCTTDVTENTTLEEIQKNKFDSQFASDMHLFSRIWVPNIHYIMTRDRRVPITPIGEI